MDSITRPYITEKTLAAAAKGYYTFVVDKKSNKAQIADAVSKHYKVTVVDVHTVSMHGKMRRVGKRQKSVRKQDWKKAIISLKEGQKIDAFDVSPEEKK